MPVIPDHFFNDEQNPEEAHTVWMSGRGEFEYRILTQMWLWERHPVFDGLVRHNVWPRGGPQNLWEVPERDRLRVWDQHIRAANHLYDSGWRFTAHEDNLGNITLRPVRVSDHCHIITLMTANATAKHAKCA